MPRRSSVLDHPKRKRIDALIAAGDRSTTSIAAEFGVEDRTLRRYAAKLRDATPKPLRQLAAESPLATFERAFGFAPLPHQATYLTESRATLIVKGRQTGYTTAAAGLAVHVALARPGSTTVIISPSLRQSSEVTDRARLAFWEWDAKLRQDSASLLRTAAGSRIVSLPGSSRGVRGYSVDGLMIIDEAAFVADDVWAAAWPLVSASGGRIIVQSTPGLAVGWFHALVTDPPADWAFQKVTSAEAGTIDAAFLERVKADMDPALFAQEYEAAWGDPLAGKTPLLDPDLWESRLYDDEDDPPYPIDPWAAFDIKKEQTA